MLVLRRGRLFTVSVAGGAMQPIDSIDAYPPGVDARDDWYDEMLIADDRVVVIGYSYRRGGNQYNKWFEVTLFGSRFHGRWVPSIVKT